MQANKWIHGYVSGLDLRDPRLARRRVIAMAAHRYIPQVKDLLALQAKSKSGVIELTQAVYDKYVTGSSRPYEIIVLAGEHGG